MDKELQDKIKATEHKCSKYTDGVIDKFNISGIKQTVETLKNTTQEIGDRTSQLKSAYENQIQQVKADTDKQLAEFESRVGEITNKMDKILKDENDLDNDKAKIIEENVTKNIDNKVDFRLGIVKDDLNTRIDDLQANVGMFVSLIFLDEVAKNFNDKLQQITAQTGGTRPTTPYNDEIKKKKKRVKSAAKRMSNIPNKKLEEMRRWLEYQRKFTADEVKKRTDKYKEMHDGLYPKIDTNMERKESNSDIRRRYNNYDQVTHPYQSTVDDLLRSRYASRIDEISPQNHRKLLSESKEVSLPDLKIDTRKI